MKIIKAKNSLAIKQTIEIFKSGGLVIFPSDTVYGLLCDASNEQAVKKLITFKNRPASKPISVFTDKESLDQLVELNKDQENVLDKILPGPYTVILPSKHKVNKLLESESGTLGIRIPESQQITRLVKEFGKPITATSANIAGRPAHYSVDTLLNEISNKQKELIDLIVDAGTLPKNKPSTVVDLSGSNIKILRQGNSSFFNSKIYKTKTSIETKSIAGQIYKANSIKSDRPLIFIIKGEMGVGKTVFVKGIGEQLGINNIISPTFVIYYEYDNFYHFDLYQIEDKNEFKNLEIEKLLIGGNILCFEWGERAGEIIDMLKEKGNIVYISMKYISESEREIIVQDLKI